jgi:hypothetical protein
VVSGQLRRIAANLEIGVPGEGKTAKSSGMGNCSITTIVGFPGFLGGFGSRPINKVVFFEFLGGVFAGGGVSSGRWSVVSRDQRSGIRGEGLGEQQVDFFATEMQISTKFILGLRSWGFVCG